MKFFAVSDIHSYFDEFYKALLAAGWDKENTTHYLVVCGDFFDRGPQPEEVLQFLLTTPRVILIRGNHEDLFTDACYRMNLLSHDFSNGTAETINVFGEKGISKKRMTARMLFANALKVASPLLVRCHNYFETKKYIFVHGYIPVREAHSTYEMGQFPMHYIEDWRTADEGMWRVARWENGMKCASLGYLEPNKLIVCGHYHASWGHSYLDDDGAEWGPKANFYPYYGDGVIAIDGCTAASGQVNVVVLEDDFLDESTNEGTDTSPGAKSL